MPELVFQDCFHPGTHSEIVSFSCPVLTAGGKSGAISSWGMGCPEVPVTPGSVVVSRYTGEGLAWNPSQS